MAITPFLTNPTTIAEIVAFIAALFCLAGRGAGYWSAFILFLLVTLSVGITGFYLRSHHHPNHILYNVFMIIQVCVYTFLFLRFIDIKKMRVAIIVLFAAFILFYIVEGIFHA